MQSRCSLCEDALVLLQNHLARADLSLPPPSSPPSLLRLLFMIALPLSFTSPSPLSTAFCPSYSFRSFCICSLPPFLSSCLVPLPPPPPSLLPVSLQLYLLPFPLLFSSRPLLLFLFSLPPPPSALLSLYFITLNTHTLPLFSPASHHLHHPP